MSDTTEENPKKVTGDHPEGTTVISNETLPAVPGEENVVDVFEDEYQDSVTGVQLAAADRPQIFKLDHKKGKYHSLDDEDDKYDYIDGVILRARSYYRRFGPSGVVCESDNGEAGFDSELKKELACKADCEYSYTIKDRKIEGQCGLGLSIQMMALLDGVATPVQLNMSATSARSFATFISRMNRKKKRVQEITTRLKSRYINGKFQTYYAGHFDMIDDKPCVDVSGMLDDGSDVIGEQVDT